MTLTDKYYKHKDELETLYKEMEDYILENCEKVTLESWNKNRFTIYPHMTKERKVFGGEIQHLFASKTLKEFFKNIKKPEGITKIEFTRDPSDGDFSVKFNGDAWTFLWEDNIVEYYEVVYECLNKK